MDFNTTIAISGILASAAILLSSTIFYSRLRTVSEDLSKPAYRSLVMFGLSGVFMAFIGIVALWYPNLTLIMTAFVFAFLQEAQIHLVVTDEKLSKSARAFVWILIGASIAETVYVLFNPLWTSIIVLAALSILLLFSIFGALYVVREIQNAYSISILLVVLLLVVSAIAGTGIVPSYPQYFFIQVAPLGLFSAVLISMLRPWRNIISSAIGFMAIIVGVSLASSAYLAGELNTILFSLAVMFAVLCTLIPMNFFVEQAVDTKTATPIYISYTLVFVSLLAITHSVGYAIAYGLPPGDGTVWDPNILFLDWFVGLTGVCTFTLAAISASFSTNVRTKSREVLIAAGAVLLTLGHPFVQNGRYELDPLYLGIAVFLVIGFAIFIRLAYKLSKVGAAGAGARFLLFMFATLFLGIIAMFANEIPLEIMLPMLVGAGVMLLLSSPRRKRTTII